MGGLMCPTQCENKSLAKLRVERGRKDVVALSERRKAASDK